MVIRNSPLCQRFPEKFPDALSALVKTFDGGFDHTFQRLQSPLLVEKFMEDEAPSG
jgi:hypothetical protein